MKIEPSGKKFDKGLYCARCGCKVPFVKKFLTQFCQIKIKNKKAWMIYISYVCPDCLAITNSVRHYSRSISKIIEKLDLYNLYNKKTK